MVGGDENAVAQVFLGMLVSSLWLSLVLYRRPYSSGWDTAISAVLGFTHLITLMSGVCLRLFELTENEADDYQKEAFGVVLVVSILMCVGLSVVSMVLSTECVRDRVAKRCARCCGGGSGGAGAGAADSTGDSGGSVRVVPVAAGAREEEEEEEDAEAVAARIEAQQAREAEQQRHHQDEMQAAAHARLERRRSTQRKLHAAADAAAAFHSDAERET